uniref:flocculation protein FLO11-like isoform X2 n=1 Tax=Solea senegalensis TaxID=28829 RepID=UPI001CD8930B|nr:flocculation protein FLO11-like isoform X2 [Solea senegalensis]
MERITVVQSYFVYWAGIKSEVVRDGSQKLWNGRKTTEKDGGTFAEQENGRMGPTEPTRPQNSRTRGYDSLETVIRQEIKNLATLTTLGNELWTNQTVSERNKMATSGSPHFTTSGSATYSNAALGTTDEASVISTKDPMSTSLSTASSSSGEEATETLHATTLLPNITDQNVTNPLTLLHFLTSFTHVKDIKMESKEREKLQDSDWPTVAQTKYATFNPQSTTSSTPLNNHSFHLVNRLRTSTHNPIEMIQDHTNSVKFRTQTSSFQPWGTSLTQTQNSHIKSLRYKQTSSPKYFLSTQIPTSKPLPPSVTGIHGILLFSATSPPKLFSKYKTLSHNSTLHSASTPQTSALPQTISTLIPEPPNHRLQPNTSVGDVNKSQPEPSQSGPRQTSPPYAECQTTDFFRTLPQPQPVSIQNPPPTTTSNQTLRFLQIKQPESDSLHESMSSSPKSWFQSTLHTGSPLAHSFEWKKTEPPQTPPSLTHLQFTIRYGPILATNQGKDVTTHDPQAKIKSISPIFAISSTTEPMFSGSTPQSALHSSSSTLTSTRPTLKPTFFTYSRFSSGKSQPKTTPALSVPPSPFPISVPPHVHPVKPSSTHSVASSNSSSPFVSITPVPLSNPPSSPSTFSKMITASTFPSSPSLISTASIPPTPPLVPTTSSYSLGSSYSIVSSVTPSFSGSPLSTSPHLGPSPAPLRSLYNSLLPSPSPVPSQKLTKGESLKIQKHLVPSDPEPNLTPPTQRTVLHQIPDPHPKLDPNIKLNRGRELKPNHPNTDTKQKHPSNPSGTPDKEGKYPDIIPRHSAWELGMLLGCSAGLGMVLVVVIRYMYRQACGKRTGVTLNDREREYERGERGLIHVQECGDLVRVRRIRENSFVLLAEYDILASPGD